MLEQFVHEVGNLPQEITHYFEEVSAKDAEMQKSMTAINAKDGALQKHVKHHGSLAKHPKEGELADSIAQHFDSAIELQTQKISLSEKACALLERQLKKLDVQIRSLQNDGQLVDGPPLPSVFHRQKPPDKALDGVPVPSLGPLQPSSTSALNMAAHRINSAINPHATPPVPRQVSQIAGIQSVGNRSSAPATPAASAQQHRSFRESSAGASDSKRRKLNNSFSLNAPSQPSSLRQSSLGPSVMASGTPKAGTPTGTGAPGARSGSVPRNSGSQTSMNGAAAAAAAAKKSGLSKKLGALPSHQQISKLKGKPSIKHARLSGAHGPGRKKGASPSVRSRSGPASDDGDSVLSSAEASDAETSSRHGSAQPSGPGMPAPHRGRRSKKELEAIAAAKANQHMQSSEVDDEGDDEDDKVYCFCQKHSFGEMVACENEKCEREWFHLECLSMKKAPAEDEVWYCPECRGKLGLTADGQKVVTGVVVKEEKDEKKRGK